MNILNRTRGFFISFLLGGAIGSSIVLLFTPKSGKQFRNDISRKTNDFINEGRKKASDIIDGAKEFADNTLDSANEVLNTGADKILRRTDKIKSAIKSGVNTYKEEVNSGNNGRISYVEEAETTH